MDEPWDLEESKDIRLYQKKIVLTPFFAERVPRKLERGKKAKRE